MLAKLYATTAGPPTPPPQQPPYPCQLRNKQTIQTSSPSAMQGLLGQNLHLRCKEKKKKLAEEAAMGHLIL